MVNRCTLLGCSVGEVCADCFDIVVHDYPERAVQSAGNSGRNHNDLGFDNVIRALEEDR